MVQKCIRANKIVAPSSSPRQQWRCKDLARPAMLHSIRLIPFLVLRSLANWPSISCKQSLCRNPGVPCLAPQELVAQETWNWKSAMAIVRSDIHKNPIPGIRKIYSNWKAKSSKVCLITSSQRQRERIWTCNGRAVELCDIPPNPSEWMFKPNTKAI